MISPAPPALTVTAAWERPLVPTSGGEATLLVRVAAAAAEATAHRAPIDVAFVLDRSGSMSGDKLDLAKRAVDVAVGRLTDDDRAALVVYDHAVDLLHPVQPATPRAKTALRLALHGVDAGGSTDLGGGWLAGCRQLSGQAPRAGSAADAGPVRLRRSILLTDGLANVGIVDPSGLTTHAHELRKRGIATTTLGLGLGFDEALLAGMAEAGGGSFGFAADASELPAFFARELQDLLTVAAAGLSIALTLPHGVRAELVSAFPHERRGKRIEVALGDLPTGDELELVFRVRAGVAAPGAAHALRLDAAWADPAADARRAAPVDLAPLVVADATDVAATTVDPLVAERAALHLSAKVRRDALALDRAGRHAESRAGMRHAAAVLRAAPMSAHVRADLSATMHFAEAGPDAGYDELDRKRAAFHDARRARGKRVDLPTDGR